MRRRFCLNFRDLFLFSFEFKYLRSSMIYTMLNLHIKDLGKVIVVIGIFHNAKSVGDLCSSELLFHKVSYGI